MGKPHVDPYQSTVRNAGDGGLDHLVPYSSVILAARLRAHTITPEFHQAFTMIVGGGLRPADGGSWERCRRASNWLHPLERKAKHSDLAHLRNKIDPLDREVKDFADLVCRLCGIYATYRSPILTEGERLAWAAAVDLAVFADIPDVFECITQEFPGAEVIQFPGPVASATGETTGTAEGSRVPSAEIADSASPPGESAGEGVSGGAPSPKPKLHVDDGITYPEGYFDDVDLDGSVTEIKRRLNHHLHAHLIAETNGKNRKGLTDWLMSKLRGFRIPEEWRES